MHAVVKTTVCTNMSTDMKSLGEQKKEVKVDEFFGAEAARKTVQEAMVRPVPCSFPHAASCHSFQWYP